MQGSEECELPLSRTACWMDWAFGDQSRIQHVIEFGSHVSDLQPLTAIHCFIQYQGIDDTIVQLFCSGNSGLIAF